MAVLSGDKRPDGKIRVWQYNEKDNYRAGWITVDTIPPFPPYKRGVLWVMIYDPQTDKFEFEEEPRKLDEAEALELVAEALNRIADNLEQ